MPFQSRLRSALALALALVVAGCGIEAPQGQQAGSLAVAAETRPGACAAQLANATTLVTGPSNDPIPAVQKPRKGVAFVEPTYRTCIVRATDHAAEAPEGFARNDYSRRQAFNADGSRFIVTARDGFWHLYDTATLAHRRVLAGMAGDAEPQWDATDPKVLYFLPNAGGLQVHRLDVEANVATVQARFDGRLPWPTVTRLWTRSEGSPSADSRYWAFQAEESGGGIVGLLVWDRVADQIVAAVNETVRPDHLSMSPSGNYVVVSWDDGVFVYDRTLTNRRKLASRGEHSDIARGAGGDDLYVSIDYASGGGNIYATNLRTLERTDLLSTYVGGTATALHLSGKAFDRPGWVVLSTYEDYGGERQWLHRKVMAVELTSNPTVVHLAHTHNVDGGYFTEPHASVNRDFTKVLFNSTWGVTTDSDVDAYLIQLPAAATAPR